MNIDFTGQPQHLCVGAARALPNSHTQVTAPQGDMAAHTAVIRVSPAIDRGYLFSLLHINEVGERDNQRGRDMLSAEIAGQVRDSVPEPEAVKVLFVEDDTDFREALAGELSDHGFAIRCFGDGE